MSAPTAERRVTPTAVRVLPADADRDVWLTRRRDGIGSSDVAAILGVSDFGTPLHVWHDKRGELDDHAGEAALWGTLLEDVVAREWCRRNRSVIARVGLIAHADQPWRLATLDRRVAECPLNRDQRTACALEIKCRSAFKAHRWHADVPDDVLAQTTWQMHITGYDHLHVAVLIGGNDYRQTVVRRDQAVEDYVVGEVTTWRERHLLAGIPPEPTGNPDRLIELDNLLHPDRVGELDIEGLGEVLEYAARSAAKGKAERELKESRAELARIAAGNRFVMSGGHLAYEFAPVTRSNCDLAALAERHPAAYADCVTTKTSYQIRLNPDLRQTGADA